MNNSTKKFLLGMALGALLAVFLLQRCNNTDPGMSLAEQRLQDSIQYYQDKHGDLIAKNITLQGERDELLALQSDHTDLIASLQRTVRRQGKKLKGVTAVATKTDMELPFDVFFQVANTDTIRQTDTLILFSNPFANLEVVKDTVRLAMTDTLTFWHQYQKRGPFKRRALNVYAKNTNPYITIEGLKSYAVLEPERRRLGFGATLGYGIGTDLKPRPMVGAGLYYRIW